MGQVVSWDDVEHMAPDAGGGTLLHYQGKPFTGLIQEFSNDGVLVGESEFIDGHADGVQREYYPNGQLREEYTTRFNKLEGIFTEWDEIGNITSQTNWLNGQHIPMSPTDLYPQIVNNIGRLYHSANTGEEVKPKISHLLLFAEYEARINEWKNALRAKGSFYGGPSTNQNLFRDLSPVWKNELFTTPFVIDDLKKLGLKHLSQSRDITAFYWTMYINWEIFKDYPEIKQFAHLPHPYEPVFKIIVLGGDIFYSENDFYVTGGRFPYKCGLRLPSTDYAFINYIDEHCLSMPTQPMIDGHGKDLK